MSELQPPAPQLVATYRLQLHAGFTFADAAAIVPYLADLGISHLYLSPIMQAVPGSMHGYDQCDPTSISKELGGESGFRQLAATARDAGLGIVLDIVPNHMAASESNPWWWELLRSGRAGRSGVYFDVDWEAPGLRDRVMVPVLGAPLPDILARGELAISDRAGEPVVAYFDQHFPLAESGGTPPDAVSDELLQAQNYRLAFWRDGAEGLNYRRFFDISTLVAVREEDPAVFVTLHALVLELVAQGDVQGLRVDHVDGLRDPRGYLETLHVRAPGAWLVVEKILEPGEHLPPDWPVDGTTGYDFIHRLQGVFMDPAGEAPLTRFYDQFAGDHPPYEELVRECKLDVAGRLFRPDVNRLERLLHALCDRASITATTDERSALIAQAAANLPVYRTYLRAGEPLAADERARVESALRAVAVADGGGISSGLLELVRAALVGELGDDEAAAFALGFQQFSGPLTAKGVEDTAFYRYQRMVCLNEVGGDPGRFFVDPAEFHTANSEAAAHYPRGMLASSTHDTKRSEDVRARLSLLSQVPADWQAAVERWSRMNERHRRGNLPDREMEYLLYQALVGAWPLDEERALAYVEKAAREAKTFTSWTDPDPEYEDSLRGFVRGVLGDDEFAADLAAFVRPLVEPGREVSLAQALVKLTAPGIPDIYQGTEAWDLSLVDPDNRRPVDYGARRELLARHGAAAEQAPVDDQLIRGRWDEGLAKLHVVAQALALRRRCPEAFAPGSTYTPLQATGGAADNVLAYARGTASDPLQVLVVVPRLTLGAMPAWTSTHLELEQGRWNEVIWGAEGAVGPTLGLGGVFGCYPLALLERAA